MRKPTHVILICSLLVASVVAFPSAAPQQEGRQGRGREPGSGPPTDTAAYALARYAVNLKYEDLPPAVVAIAKRRLLDTLGCVYGGYNSEVATILRDVIGAEGGAAESTIIGSGQKVSAENATLVNGNMIRYLDFNDTYWSTKGYMHPSNSIAEALAMAERQHASGKDLIVAIVLAYEVQTRLIDTFRFPGFQQHSGGGFTAPVVAGKLLKLNADQMANAIGIAGGTNFTLQGVYGDGFTSMMKSYGYASGSKAGVTAALLAQKGFTGPVTIIESYNRAFEKNVPLTTLVTTPKQYGVTLAWMKPYEAFHVSHSPISGVIDLVKRDNIKPDQIENVFVRGLPTRANTERRRNSTIPRTKEEADHNLNFLLAMAITDGEVGTEQYAEQQWKNPKVQELMKKMEFQGDAELTKDFPDKWVSIVEITTKDQKVHSLRVDLPKGGPNNPMTDQEIESKFNKMALKLMRKPQADSIIKSIYDLDKMTDVSQLMKLLAIPKS
jgi:2-methylcitrate dehydratase